ncbi:ATP-grasp domain-containing protein [Lysinibacillus antri]|nr:ATP-grasp domain-containing protein [Lysinibacillus antri]
MKKLLMLGGAPSQIPAIQTAKRLGYYVITCDYLESNPGHQFSDEYHNVSTVDKEAVLELARSLQINGIVCYAADSGAPTVAYVAEKLGLPSFPYSSVELLSNKDQFRAFLEENHFDVPKAKGYSTFDEAVIDFDTFIMPVMVKPVDSSGSRGVTKIFSINELQDAVTEALSFSRTKRFVIEEFIEKTGYQIGLDCFSVNGQLTFCGFGNNHFGSAVNPFLPIVDSCPTYFSTHIQNKVRNEIQRFIDLFNLRTGPTNFEIQIDRNERVFILDMGVRNCGDFTKLLKYATGVDLIEYTIKAAMGEDCKTLRDIEPKGFWAIYSIFNEENGILQNIQIDSIFKKENVFEYVESVSKFGLPIKANENLGNMVLTFSSMKEMLEKINNIKNLVKVVIKETSYFD